MGPSALLVALFALAPGEGSEVEPTRLRLRWSAPPSCPPADDARQLVQALTGARIVDDAASDAEAEVRIDPSGAGFAGRVHARGPDGEHTRELVADDCGVLSRALALVVAVGLDAVAVASRAEVSEEPVEASPDPAPTPPPVEPRSPVPRTDRAAATPRAESVSRASAAPAPASSREGLPRGLELGGRVALGVGGLVLPGAGLGVQAGPYIGTRFVHVHVVAEYWTARTIVVPGDRSATAELRLATGGVRGCGVIERGRVRVPLCAGVDGGAVLAEGAGAGLSSSASPRAPWAAVIVQPGVALEVAPWLSLFVAFEGAVSLYRPRFRFEGMAENEDLFTVGAFGPRGFVGLELHAPRAVRARARR
jgi:hypothetical protein